MKNKEILKQFAKVGKVIKHNGKRAIVLPEGVRTSTRLFNMLDEHQDSEHIIDIPQYDNAIDGY